MAHYILKGFLVSAVLISYSLKKRSLKALYLVKNGNFSFLSLFCWPFLLPKQR